jgi:uncharacterized protein YbbK (DUF523 family)
MTFIYCVHYYKKDSPSSGLCRVKVHDQNGMPSKTGTGIFPAEVMKRFPLLPLECEICVYPRPMTTAHVMESWTQINADKH